MEHYSSKRREEERHVVVGEVVYMYVKEKEDTAGEKEVIEVSRQGRRTM